jgi:hypothetical protein
LHPTPLCGEQDRCVFETQNQHYTSTVLFLAARVKRQPLGAGGFLAVLCRIGWGRERPERNRRFQLRPLSRRYFSSKVRPRPSYT